MSNESQVLQVNAGASSKNVTGQVSLVDSSGNPLRLSNGIMVNGTTMIYVGACTTRDTVRAEVGTAGAVGSVYFSSAGKIYLKVANADATADWAKVTSSAAD